MTTPTSLVPGGAIFAVAMRLCALDPNGFPAGGLNTFTTNALIKATLTPVVETGDDIVVKGASGDLLNAAKHGDMIKYATCSIELATPDPFLEQILAGGTVLNDSATALGLPTGLAATATATAGVGSEAIAVSPSQSVTITIAAANLVPVFVDSGAATPFGALPLADMTAGPGLGVGYQAPPNLSVANPNGVSIELFSKRWKGGAQATDYPYFRTVLPAVRNFHVMPRDYTDANLQNVFEGQAFPNPSWGSGPFGDWQFDSTQWFQRAVCGAQILPVPGVAAVIAPA